MGDKACMDIQYFDRTTGKIETEKVYGEKAVKFIYDSFWGKILGFLISRKWISRIYGALQSSSLSKYKVLPFIKNFSIKIEEFEIDPSYSDSTLYGSFNDFFIRKFKPGKREFVQDEKLMPAFCEARYLGYNSVTDNLTFPVKGKFLRARDLLGNHSCADDFIGGPLMIARLCPVDYHRFHFPLDAKVTDFFKLSGELHSVNPWALKMKNDIFIKNERHVTILESPKFGKLAYVEVGATCVGKIVQSSYGEEVKRGQQKGYFLFGGSTVVLLGQPGKWLVSEDIRQYTSQNKEVYLHLGDPVARLRE
jgi:phosphatidylserine decarboxylase